MTVVPRPPRLLLVYRSELTPFLTGDGPDPSGRRALVLLADADGYVEVMAVCTITRRTNTVRSTVLLLLDGWIDGEPITSVAYTLGNPFPITAAGRRCVIHVDNHQGDHVDDMLKIWKPRLAVPTVTEAPVVQSAPDNPANP